MMRRAIFVLLLIAGIAPRLLAQFTLVTGTVTDPNGLPYANGTITAALVTLGTTPKITAGGASFSMTGSAGLNKAGAFSMRLVATNMMTPALQWRFQVCSDGGTIPPPLGAGPVCFLVGPLTISGATQDITSQITAAALIIGGFAPLNNPLFTTGIRLAGSVSGVSTISAPVTGPPNGGAPFIFSNVISVPAGTATNPGLSMQATNNGLFSPAAGVVSNSAIGVETDRWASNLWTVPNPMVFQWDLAAIPSTAATQLTQSLIGGRGTLQVGVSGLATTAGVLSQEFIAEGTKFTASGCANSATVGGGTAGTYTSGTTGTCTVTLTMGGASNFAAPHAWTCSSQNRTHPANVPTETAAATTTVTISGTTTTGDVIAFWCMGY